ncbi:hypothetical protein NW754_010500 [Fusarium falciforme]|nr:hypothetical protein NW754_010500 [Fusarium falciforme]
MKSVLITAVLASAGALAQSSLPATFIASYNSCVATSCSAEDAAKAVQYGVQLCGSAGVSVSGEAPATEAPAASSEAPEAPSAPSAPAAPATPSAPEAPTAPSAPAPPYPPKPSKEVPPVVPSVSKPAEVPATPATPTAVAPTAGAGMVQVSNAIILSVGLSMMLVLLN